MFEKFISILGKRSSYSFCTLFRKVSVKTDESARAQQRRRECGVHRGEHGQRGPNDEVAMLARRRTLFTEAVTFDANLVYPESLLRLVRYSGSRS